jgi:hypothetical protein
MSLNQPRALRVDLPVDWAGPLNVMIDPSIQEVQRAVRTPTGPA